MTEARRARLDRLIDLCAERGDVDRARWFLALKTFQEMEACPVITLLRCHGCGEYFNAAKSTGAEFGRCQECWDDKPVRVKRQ